MTLIVTLPTADGIVLATDSQSVVGQYKDRVQKIQRLNNKIVWVATGEQSLIQRVQQSFSAFTESNHSLKELLVTIGSMMKNSVKDLLSMDFRTEIYVNNFNAISQLHRADFVFAEWTDSPQIVHMHAIGSPNWVTTPYIVGSGDSFVGALLNRYRHIPMAMPGATILAYRLVDEAIETGMFGLGGGVDVWQVTSEGYRNLDETEVDRIKDTLGAVRKHEITVFEKHVSMDVSH